MLKDFLQAHPEIRASISLVGATWYASFEDRRLSILAIENGRTFEEAVNKAVSEATDRVTKSSAHLVLLSDALTNDPDGYFRMRTNRQVNLGHLSQKELKNYLTWDRTFWSFHHDGFIFHCGPVLQKEGDSDIYLHIETVFKHTG